MQGRAVAVEQPPAVLQDSQIMHASSSPHKDLYIDNRLLLQLSPLCTSALATTAQAAMQAALGKHISPISHANAIGRPARRSAVVPQRRLAVAAASQQQGPSSSRSERQLPQRRPAGPATLAQLAALWAAAALPAQASEALSGGPPASSYYVSLGLFVMTVPGGLAGACRAAAGGLGAPPRPSFRTAACRPLPHRHKLPRPAGLWSLIKRSPKAKIKRKTFEVAGPGNVRPS